MTPTQDEFRPIKNARDLGLAIRLRRKALGMTQEYVAAQIGIARVTVGAIENGKETAQVGIVLQICADLGMNLAESSSTGKS